MLDSMFRATLAATLVLTIGCGPDNRDPTGGGPDGGGSGDAGANQDGCSDAAKLVYVVDENYQLAKFEPLTKTFTNLGALSCNAGALATPFSMSVDREANAWVLYDNGKLFKVSTETLMCTATTWSTQLGLSQYGMGFSTDTAGGTVDSLFVAGGPNVTGPTSTLARIDTGTMQAQSRGTVAGSPELTGTGNAELWGFFPAASGARVAKIDKTSGAESTMYQAAALAGEPRAWAFAYWGGDFWIFLMKATDQSTTVYQMSGSTGQIVGMTAAPGRTIVGAGVSTCAPTVIL